MLPAAGKPASDKYNVFMLSGVPQAENPAFSRRREARKRIFQEKSSKIFGDSRINAYLCNVKIINAAEEKPLSNHSAFFMPTTFKEQNILHRVGIRKRPGGFSVNEP